MTEYVIRRYIEQGPSGAFTAELWGDGTQIAAVECTGRGRHYLYRATSGHHTSLAHYMRRAKALVNGADARDTYTDALIDRLVIGAEAARLSVSWAEVATPALAELERRGQAGYAALVREGEPVEV